MPDEPKSIMRSLGEFFGHIAKGVRSNPNKREIRRTVEEERREDGLLLRRTVIEEVELRPGQRPKPPAEGNDEQTAGGPADSERPADA